MKRYITGIDRSQSTLFPESLEEYITEDNPTRVIDVFVDELNLEQLGFQRAQPSHTGRPAYHPSTLLKLYIYGYFNRIQSSRGLERETHRNIELMWLLRRLTPDFKTIADFRKDNGKAIRNVCRAFVELCRQLDLFTEAVVAIDGSKFMAVNKRDRNYTQGTMKRRKQQVEQHIDKYMALLDKADRKVGSSSGHSVNQVKKTLTRLRAKMKALDVLEKEVKGQPDNQISLSDPDSRLMKTRGNQRKVCYNVQTAVDTRHHLIVAHEVNNRVSDRSQLSNMAQRASDATGIDKLTVLADKGYYAGPDIIACQEAGFRPLLPRTFTSIGRCVGRFTKQDFDYDRVNNRYRCPAGEWMPYKTTIIDANGMKQYNYRSRAPVCAVCHLKKQCTTAPSRRIKRWEHEDRLDDLETELHKEPDAMLIRKQTVEHPFGTLKAWMGATHFKMRRLKHVRTEMSLHVLAYNLRRMISIMGVQPLIEAAKA